MKSTVEKLTEKEIELAKTYWAEVYINTDPDSCDIHGKFADLLGCSRQRAKEVCWRFVHFHKSYFFNDFIYNLKLRTCLVNEIREYEGKSRTVYEVLDGAEKNIEGMDKLKERLKREREAVPRGFNG